MHWLAVWFRGWFFGVVLGAVLGGGLGTFAFPGLGTVIGVMYGAPIGAVAGLAQGLLVVLCGSFDVSPIADRIWSAMVAGAVALVVTMELPLTSRILGTAEDMADNRARVLVVVLAACSAAAGATAGRFITCGATVDGLRRPRRVLAAGAILGAVLAVLRVVTVPGGGTVDLTTVATLVGVGAVSGCVLAALALLVRIAELA